MSSESATTLLAQVRALVTVDVDSMDPDVAARYSTPNKFCDMTSNQAIVHGQAARPERSDLLKAAVEYVRSQAKADAATFEQDVVDVLVSSELRSQPLTVLRNIVDCSSR
jgi:transaldolase